MNKVLLARMKTNHSFELIPEETEESMDNTVKSEPSAGNTGGSGNTDTAAFAQQAAIAARIFQAQQNHLGGNLPAELALQHQLFNHHHQMLQHKILEEQLARNRDFLFLSEADREKQMGAVLHQVSYQLFVYI